MNNTKLLTRGGIYTAISVLLVYLSNVLPTSKLSILTISSAVIPLSILTIKVKSTILVYAATSLICIILGLRVISIAYIFFFGLYGIVKYYIEHLGKLALEIILKLIFFNISFFIVFFLKNEFIDVFIKDL